MKSRSSFLFLILLVCAAALWCPAARAEDAGTGPGAAAPVNQPAPTPAPAQPAPVARKEDETNPEPTAEKKRQGFIAGVLAAVAGNKTVNATLADKDKEIATLTANVAALNARIDELQAALNAANENLTEATAWVQGVATGAINPVSSPAPNPAAAAAAEATTNGISGAIRAVGVPVAALEAPSTPAPLAAVSGGKMDEATRAAALRNYWKDLGHSIPAPATIGSN